MKLMSNNSFYSYLSNFALFLLFASSQAQADANQFAGYVGISTVGPFQTVEVAGNVGIGTQTPGTSLDVHGTVRAIGLTMTGSSPVTGDVLTAASNVGIGTWSLSNTVGGMTLVATCSPSSATSCTFSNLSPGVRYHIVSNLIQNTGTGSQELRFNADTGTNYYYNYCLLGGTSNQISSSGSSNASSIVLWSGLGSTYPSQYIIDFQTWSGNNDDVIVYDTASVYYTTGTQPQFESGIYIGSSSLTSVTILTSANSVSGTIALYSKN